MFIGNTQTNTNRHLHAHKCFNCAGIEPATSLYCSVLITTEPNAAKKNYMCRVNKFRIA